jgi:GDP-mannose transporter
MRKRIKITGFKDWDSMYYNNLLSIPVLVVASVIVEDWGFASLEANL